MSTIFQIAKGLFDNSGPSIEHPSSDTPPHSENLGTAGEELNKQPSHPITHTNDAKLVDIFERTKEVISAEEGRQQLVQPAAHGMWIEATVHSRELLSGKKDTVTNAADRARDTVDAVRYIDDNRSLEAAGADNAEDNTEVTHAQTSFTDALKYAVRDTEYRQQEAYNVPMAGTFQQAVGMDIALGQDLLEAEQPCLKSTVDTAKIPVPNPPTLLPGEGKDPESVLESQEESMHDIVLITNEFT